jgi:hypothetical protein
MCWMIGVLPFGLIVLYAKSQRRQFMYSHKLLMLNLFLRPNLLCEGWQKAWIFLLGCVMEGSMIFWNIPWASFGKDEFAIKRDANDGQILSLIRLTMKHRNICQTDFLPQIA